MSQFNLEWAIAAWRRQYDTRHAFGAADLDELERHLRDQTAFLVDKGMDEEAAYRKAVAELGTVFEAEDEYRKVFWRKLRMNRRSGHELRWRLSMMARYLRSGVRSLQRQKVVSFINVFGLSIALASAVCTYIFLDAYLGMDDFHEKGERIWLVNHEVLREGQRQAWGTSPLALAPAAGSGIAGVDRAVRSSWQGGRAITQDDVFETNILFVDPGYLDVMTFPVIAGNPTPLASGNGVAITPDAATKLFGADDPLGRTLSISLGGQERFDVVVESLLAPLPGASGVRFEIMAPFPLLAAVRSYEDDDWSQLVGGTLLLLEPGADPRAVEAGLAAFVSRQRDANPGWPVEQFFLDNLRDPDPRATRTYNRLMEAPSPLFVFILVLIPAAMLMLSIFNYVNIAIGSAERRLREIGIRKVVGGQRSQLVMQFLTENLVLCALSLAIAGFLSWAFLLPMFDQIFVYALTWEPLAGPGFWVAMLSLLLGTAFVSGAYPALYISSFQPVTVFRGRMALPARRALSHAFLTMQFVVAFICILLGMYMAIGNDFQRRDNWGYDPESVVSVAVSSPEQARILMARLEARTDIRSMASTADHIGFGQRGATITVDGREQTTGHLRVGAAYFETLGLTVRRGRGFESGYGADDRTSAVVTPMMARQMGWSDPLDQTFRLNGEELTVVGLVDDPALHPVIRHRPLFFTRVPDSLATRVIIAGHGVTGTLLLDIVSGQWGELFPEMPFDGLAQSAVFDLHLESWHNMTSALLWMALLALIISCMGLFGLASQGVSARIKEISIRKVLGANPWWVALRVHARYLVLITIGAAIAMPLVYFGITIPVRLFELDYITVGPGIFVAAYAVVLVTALLSIAKHAWTLAKANPAAVLRGE